MSPEEINELVKRDADLIQQARDINEPRSTYKEMRRKASLACKRQIVVIKRTGNTTHIIGPFLQPEQIYTKDQLGNPVVKTLARLREALMASTTQISKAGYLTQIIDQEIKNDE